MDIVRSQIHLYWYVASWPAVSKLLFDSVTTKKLHKHSQEIMELAVSRFDSRSGLLAFCLTWKNLSRVCSDTSRAPHVVHAQSTVTITLADFTHQLPASLLGLIRDDSLSSDFHSDVLVCTGANTYSLPYISSIGLPRFPPFTHFQCRRRPLLLLLP